MSASFPRLLSGGWKPNAREKISFKDWAINGQHSVLVLPNTEKNVDVNGPLNQLFFKALTNILLQHKYSSFMDNLVAGTSASEFFSETN